MAKKKEDPDFEYEDEETAEDEESDSDDEYDEDFDEDGDDDDDEEEEGDKKGGGAVKIAILAVLFILAIGAGAFAYMTTGGGIPPFVASIPVIGPMLVKPTPLPQPIAGMVNIHKSPFPTAASMSTDPTTTQTAHTTSTHASGTLAVTPAGTTVPRNVATDVKPASVAKPDPPKPEPEPEDVIKPEPPPIEQVEKPKSVKVAKRWAAKKAQKRKRAWRGATNAGTGGNFSVQVGSFSQPDNAQRLISSLRSQGFEAFGTGQGTGGSFTVRSNIVDSRVKANQLASQFRLAGWSPRVQSVDRGQYALWLGTYGTQEQASKLVADLNSKGLFATVSGRAGSGGGGGPNRVWVGRYANRAEAEAAASRLKASVGAAIVVRR